MQLRARAETVQLGGTQLPDAPRLRLGRLSIPLNHLRHLRAASFTAHRLVYHSGSRVIKKKKKETTLVEGGAQCLENTTAASSGSVQGGR